jgi:hypothetical protein
MTEVSWRKKLNGIRSANRKKTVEKEPCLHPETFMDWQNNDLVCAVCYKVLRWGNGREPLSLSELFISEAYTDDEIFEEEEKEIESDEEEKRDKRTPVTLRYT